MQEIMMAAAGHLDDVLLPELEDDDDDDDDGDWFQRCRDGKISEKSCYGNPINYHICILTQLGISALSKSGYQSHHTIFEFYGTTGQENGKLDFNMLHTILFVLSICTVCTVRMYV
jgi:hypothetical protein